MATGGGEDNIKHKEEVDNVRVAVRCRPMNKTEIKNNNTVIVHVDQTNGEILVNLPHAKSTREPTKTFTFDMVFGADTTQAEVYNETARPIVDAVLEGYNGTIFAYGQTGTGKTYTMAGENVPETRGIIPNSFAHIFGYIAKCEGQVQFLVRVSYLEIYNEDIRDLLNKKTDSKLQIRERTDIGVYVKDLSSFVVKNADEMDKLMNIGNKNRIFGATDMNERSSRSHTIFTITVEQSVIGPDMKAHVKMGKLHLVDLAGSERISKTGATGVRKDEASNINRSLTFLGIVIRALVDGKSTHIPYRNSKLTHLLQDSLGGNSKTVMIANIGPADYNSDETLNTLRYANRAKNIKNKAHINEDPKDAMLREFQKEIDKLKKILAEESGEEESSDDDDDDDDGGGGKVMKKKKKKKKSDLSSSLSPQAMAQLKREIEKEREQLKASKDMAEGEKNKIQTELEKKEEELKKAQEEQADLMKRLSDLESKVIVGGVNLLEEAEKQEKLLEKSRKDLEKRKKKESMLREQLKKKEVERQSYEEKIANLQESTVGITQQLKDTWRLLQSTKDELIVVQEEYQREKEDLLHDIRQLDKDIGLQALIMDSFIPQEFQELIEHHAIWDEEAREWHLHAIAYAGNSMRRPPSPPLRQQKIHWDTLSAYLSYTTTSDKNIGGMGVVSSRSHSRAGKTSTFKKTSTSTAPKSSRRKSSTTSDTSDISEYPTSRGLISRQKHFA